MTDINVAIETPPDIVVAIAIEEQSIVIEGVPGPGGASGQIWRNGHGPPDDALGADGDYYLDDDTGDVYNKLDGTYGTPIAKLGGGGGGGNTKLTASASRALSGHRCLIINAATGEATYLNAATSSHAGAFAGVSTDAAAQGDTVSYLTAGVIEEPSWNWNTGPVFLSGLGFLTQDDPTPGAAFALIVGVALSPTALLIAPKDSYLL